MRLFETINFDFEASNHKTGNLLIQLMHIVFGKNFLPTVGRRLKGVNETHSMILSLRFFIGTFIKKVLSHEMRRCSVSSKKAPSQRTR